MGIFSNLSANRKIIKRLELLEEDAESFRKAARRLADLDLEFSGLWGKVNRAVSRMEKRAATIEESQEPPEEDAGGEPVSPSEGFDLTPEQLKWQKRILAERRRLTG